MRLLRYITVLTILSLTTSIGCAQNAQKVLDKTASVINHKEGSIATFVISGQDFSETTGTIYVKGKMFKTILPNGIIWFDGTTQWTYLRNNEEVNINTPTDTELQNVNPYNFIYMYRNGYKASMKTKDSSYIVTLTATDKKKSIQTMDIVINKKTNIPSQVRMMQNDKWITINVNSYKQAKLTDNTFTFNVKDYPDAEIIDLR